MLVAGVGGCGAALVGASRAGSFLPLLLLLMLAGFAGASVQSASGRAVMAWFPARQRGVALGIRQTAIPISGFAASLALPPLVHHGGTGLGFATMGGACLVAAAVGGLVLRERTVSAPASDEQRVKPLRDPRLWRVSIGSALVLAPQNCVLGFAVLFLHDHRGLSPGAAAGVLAVVQALGVAGRIGAGRWSDVVGSRLRPLRAIALVVAVLVAVTAALVDAPLISAPAVTRRRGRARDELEQPLVRGRRRARRVPAKRRRDRAAAVDPERLGNALPAALRRARRRDVVAVGLPRGCALPARRLARAASIARVSSILDRLDQIYAIAQHRAGYSPEEDAAHDLAAAWMVEAGLEVSRDDVGNLFGSRGAAKVWCGSHLDSVPTGGRFDGALGVVAAIEAAARLPDAPLAVVAFRSEESGLPAAGGSRRDPRHTSSCTSSRGRCSSGSASRSAIVTAIAGQARGSVTFTGRADHAGTTPMDAREDALVEAATFVLHVRDCARDGAVATVGAVEVEPNATNVVPARVTVSVDARAPEAAALDALIAAIGFEPDWRLDPVPMSGPPLEALRAAAPDAPELVSGAGHDAMFIGATGVPVAMLFVRSLNGGISHHPDELSSEDDIALAVDALTAALDRLTQ